jgi:hypothetical protein
MLQSISTQKYHNQSMMQSISTQKHHNKNQSVPPLLSAHKIISIKSTYVTSRQLQCIITINQLNDQPNAMQTVT